MKSSGKTLFLLALFFSLGLGIYFSSRANTTTVNTTPIRAEDAECAKCAQEDPCCQRMIETQDYHECDWADPRGYCKPSTCSQLPPGKEGQGNCGWYWKFHDANANEYHIGTNTPQGYGCMIGETEGTMVPRCGRPTDRPNPTARPTSPVVPSNTPKPTKRPKATAIPTQPVQPTQNPQNTVSPTSSFFPTNAPQPTTTTIYNNDATFKGNNFNPVLSNQPYPDQQIFPVFSLPNIPIPHLDIVGPAAQAITTVDAQLPRTLDFFEYAFSVVQIADRKLELFINSSFSRLLGR